MVELIILGKIPGTNIFLSFYVTFIVLLIAGFAAYLQWSRVHRYRKMQRHIEEVSI
jgi:hypothetical protein